MESRELIEHVERSLDVFFRVLDERQARAEELLSEVVLRDSGIASRNSFTP